MSTRPSISIQGFLDSYSHRTPPISLSQLVISNPVCLKRKANKTGFEWLE